MKKLIDSLSLIVLVMSLAGCGLLGGGAAQGTLTASGTIEADRIHVSAELAGKIVELKVDKGDSVKAGDVVFRLDDTAMQAQRKQAEAGLQLAQASQASAQANFDLVKAGSTDSQLQAAQAQADAAEANRKAVQATLWEMTSGSRPEDIATARARLDWARKEYYGMTVTITTQQQDDAQAALNTASNNLTNVKSRQSSLEADKRTPTSALDAAASAIVDAQTALDAATTANQDLQDTTTPFYQQIEAVQNTWEVAQLNLSQAQARQTVLKADTNMTQVALDSAQSTVDDAQTMVDKSKKAYDNLSTGDQANRLKTAWDQLTNAQNDLNNLGRNQLGGPDLETVLEQMDAATAQSETANANLTNLKNGSRPEQIAVAQGQLDAAKAQVAAAQAALDLIDVQLAKLTVSAPVSGVILVRSLNLGEMAAPGVTVMELGAIDQVKLTVYIPEDQYGQIKLGQGATIKVDSFPGKTYSGSVDYISDQAEFTPRNVQTVESRSTTVYAVEISIPNASHELKPGMPADATFK